MMYNDMIYITDEVNSICEKLGVNARHVVSILIEPFKTTITSYVYDDQNKIVVFGDNLLRHIKVVETRSGKRVN